MPLTLNIASLDDIPRAVEALLDHPEDSSILEPGECRITIKLQGDSWDGLVDVRVARFVVEVQKAVDRFRRECGIEGAERPLVKVKVKDGSTDIEAELIQTLQNLVTNMSPNQTFIVALSIVAGLFGYWSVKSLFEMLDKRHQRALEKQGEDAAAQAKAKEIEVFNETIKFAITKIDPERPARTLISSMNERDQIQLPGAAESMNREQVKTIYPRKPRTNPIQLLIDDNYHVTALGLENPVKFTLSRGDTSFKADLGNKVSEDDKVAFLTKTKSAFDTGTQVRVALHIDAMVGDRGIHSATIVAIGHPPREGAVDVSSIFE